MKHSDIWVIAVIYAVSLLFFVMTIDLPPDAQTYPMGLIVALAGFNTLFFIQCLFRAIRTGGIRFVNDFPELFKGMLVGQFAFVCAGCFIFLCLVYAVGYYLASALYLAGTLAFFKVPGKWIALTLVTLVVLVYAVFTMFLKVPLPVGMLFA